MVSAPWPTILPIIDRPELMEETSGAAEAATARRGIVESRWSSTVSLWDFPSMSHSYSLHLAWKLASDDTIVRWKREPRRSTRRPSPHRLKCCEWLLRLSGLAARCTV